MAKAEHLKHRIWLDDYAADVPAEIGPIEHNNLGEFFETAFKMFPDRKAHTCMGTSITYQQWNDYSRHFGAWLQSLGLEPGARVAVMLPNIIQTPIVIAAIVRAGFVLSSINPLYTPREVKNQLNNSGAEAIIVLENFAANLEQVVADTSLKHVCVTTMGDMSDGQLFGIKSALVNFVVRRVKKMVPEWDLPNHVPYLDALLFGQQNALKPSPRTQDDIALLQYTGGTTGIPKAAMITHLNVLSNIEQCGVWIQSGLKAKSAPENVTFICALPLFHIFALTVNLMIATRIGGHNLLIPNPRDIPSLIKDLKNNPVHVFGGLNTLYNALLNNKNFRKLDFSNLLITASGGMKTQTAVANRWKTITDSTILECYGLSETSPVVSGNRFDAENFSGTIGIPIPSTNVEIRNDDNKKLPAGEIGEICISGPQVMAGYWNNPEETELVFTKDKMFKSGDMGFMDKSGYITIVDRLKDMILISGFNVYPNEIEDVVTLLDGVHECAAVGLANEHGQEDIKLFVVRKDEDLTEADIRIHCKEQLTNYKRPKYISFYDELPKSNVGKILRRELKNI